MKRKIFEKILVIGSVIVALVFVIVLLITMFGGIKEAEFDNKLVQGLFMTLGIVFLVLSSGIITYQFIDSDAVKEIVINADKETSTKATAAVIKRLAKKHVASIEGVKCSRVVISLSEYGVRLKLGIRVIDKEIQEVAALLKCLLDDVFYDTLGYRFYAIDFKVLSLKSAYEANMDEVEEKAKEEIEKQKESLEKELDNEVDTDKKTDESSSNDASKNETQTQVD